MRDGATPGGVGGDGAVSTQARTDVKPVVTVALAVALFALSALDLVVTEIGVVYYGATELNPLMASILGTPWALVVKLGLPAVIVILAYKVRTAFAVRALRVAVAVYVVVVIFNLAQFAVVAGA
jgi:hypothetical protein